MILSSDYKFYAEGQAEKVEIEENDGGVEFSVRAQMPTCKQNVYLNKFCKI